MANIYKPELMEVIAVRQQTIDVKSVALRFLDPERAKTFSFQVGQFGIFSVFGFGESTFNICSSSNWKDRIEFCFRKVGRVTEAHVESRSRRCHRLPRTLRQRLSDGMCGRDTI